MSTYTPGPWRWEFNKEHRTVHLAGGRRLYDLTVMDFERWGMNGATMRLRDPEHDGMQLLYRVHERPDWITPAPGREHHKNWFQLLTHPDARLIAAAPELLEACKLIVSVFDALPPTSAARTERLQINAARAAIAKATGEAT